MSAQPVASHHLSLWTSLFLKRSPPDTPNLLGFFLASRQHSLGLFASLPFAGPWDTGIPEDRHLLFDFHSMYSG